MLGGQSLFENRSCQSQRRGATRPKKLTDEHRIAIMSWIDEDCSITLKAMAARLADRFAITVGASTINRAIDDFHFSWKRTSIIPFRRNDDEAEFVNFMPKLISV